MSTPPIYFVFYLLLCKIADFLLLKQAEQHRNMYPYALAYIWYNEVIDYKREGFFMSLTKTNICTWRPFSTSPPPPFTTTEQELLNMLIDKTD